MKNSILKRSEIKYICYLLFILINISCSDKKIEIDQVEISFEKNKSFIKGKWGNWKFNFFDTARPVKKIELAAILNSYSPLFESCQVNHQGVQTYRIVKLEQ